MCRLVLGLTVVSKHSHPFSASIYTGLHQPGPVGCGIATNVLTSNLVCRKKEKNDIN